jgi:hypothetical protein
LKKFTDIKLNTENELISCHKCILLSRSNVFKKMFTIDMKESYENNNIISLADVLNQEVNNEILLLFYGENLDNILNHKNSVHVMFILRYLELFQYEFYCRKIISHYLDFDNLLDILNISVLLNDSSLKNDIFNFIRNNSNLFDFDTLINLFNFDNDLVNSLFF